MQLALAISEYIEGFEASSFTALTKQEEETIKTVFLSLNEKLKSKVLNQFESMEIQ
ncbi:MAG: hypothetical protein MHPSP_000956, partial [Paramarteilia canceri]